MCSPDGVQNVFKHVIKHADTRAIYAVSNAYPIANALGGIYPANVSPFIEHFCRFACSAAFLAVFKVVTSSNKNSRYAVPLDFNVADAVLQNKRLWHAKHVAIKLIKQFDRSLRITNDVRCACKYGPRISCLSNLS